MTVEHEPTLAADLDATYDPWQAALLGLHVVHVLLKDELLEVGQVVGGVLLLGDQIQVCAHDDDRGVGGASL